MNQRLHFSLGPVQNFVTQSRRTRDLWASSFLLSHLSTVALDVVGGHGGQIVLPAWDAEAKSNAQQPDFGTVPNRFVVDVADGRATAEAASAALHSRWKEVADAVWNQYVTGVAQLGDGTQAIWDREVANFWEISWVIGSPESSDQLLAARKNWRTTPATVEPGDHCTMMGDRQELSGWIRSLARTKTKQDEFWSRLRSQTGKLDLGDDERLCAIALIKRLFPRVANEAIGRPLNQNNWPSTAYVAAIPWLQDVASNANLRSDVKAYGEMVRQLAENALGERQTRIKSLQPLKNVTGDFLKLDGNFFQPNALKSSRVTPFQNQLSDEEDKVQRDKLQERLKKLCKVAESKPSAFYAVLLMDGDSMGALLAEARNLGGDGEQRATRALSRFSRNVPDIVSQSDGITIYAGGDDVLAMLPLRDTLPCAISLTDEYQRCFKTECGEVIDGLATLSGSIVYAHYHTPLRDVLATAHHLLDDIAKDVTGRDSLAIAVFKSSGINTQWSAPWKHIREDESGNLRADGGNILDDLVESLKPTDAGRPGEFSTGFLYSVRDRFAALTDSALTRPGEFGKLSKDLQQDRLFERVLEADYLRGLSHSRGEEGADQNKGMATEAIQRLLKLCQRVTRKNVGTKDSPQFKVVRDENTLGIDGALLVRFLASDGKEDAE